MSSTPHEQLPQDLIRATGRRIKEAVRRMDAQSLDALLVSFEVEIRYLTGFVGHQSLLLVTPETAVIITDPRYDEYLNPWRSVGHLSIALGTRHRLLETVRSLCRDRRARRLGVQAERMTLEQRKTLGELLPEAEVVETSGLVTEMRRRKDEVEIAAIEEAIGTQQEAMRATLEDFRASMTEFELGARLEYEMKMRGAAGPSFDIIIGAGANSSIIHHSTAETPIEPGVLLLDWGARAAAGYCGDMTRTYAVGRLPTKIREIYPIVLEAQLAAIDAAAPGRTCAEIDSIARTIITKAGYGDSFGHGLGHGVGLEIHEAPFFNSLETKTLLEPGMVMTVEPGIYLPRVGGVRIEDDILITPNGCRVLTAWPKEPDSCVLVPGLARQAPSETVRT